MFVFIIQRTYALLWEVMEKDGVWWFVFVITGECLSSQACPSNPTVEEVKIRGYLMFLEPLAGIIGKSQVNERLSLQTVNERCLRNNTSRCPLAPIHINAHLHPHMHVH